MNASSPEVLPRPRAILYLRQSTYREESISLELQETAGREHARQHGYDVVGVESDPGISGRTWNRPGVQRVMAAIEERRADVIILWKWSRLSRARLDWAVAVDRIESFGGRIESATEPIDTSTSAGRLARGLMAEYAAFTSESIGEVWKETQQRRRLRGLPPNGGNRYGYIRDGDTYELDPEFAPVLADLFRRHVAGEGHQALAMWLNRQGYRTRTEIPWTRDKVRLMMDSGFAAGVIVQGRLPNARYYPGVHPPIINSDLWAAYLHRRRAVPIPPKVSGRIYWLSGLLFCDDCGSPMRAASRNGKSAYVCSRALDTGMVRTVTCVRERAEAHVLAQLRAFAKDVDAVKAFELAALRASTMPINDEQGIERRLDKLRTQARSITLRWSSGRMLETTYDDAIAEVERQIRDLEERERVARASAGSAARRAEALEAIGRWRELTVAERHGIATAFIQRVRVIPPAVKKRGGAGPVTFDEDWHFPRHSTFE